MNFSANFNGLAMVLFLSTFSVTAARPSVVWDCVVSGSSELKEDGNIYLEGYVADNFVRDVSIYWTVDTLFLTHCKNDVMGRVGNLGRVERDGVAKRIGEVYDDLVLRFIATLCLLSSSHCSWCEFVSVQCVSVMCDSVTVRQCAV